MGTFRRWFASRPIPCWLCKQKVGGHERALHSKPIETVAERTARLIGISFGWMTRASTFMKTLGIVMAGATIGGLVGAASGIHSIHVIADAMQREHGWVCGTGFPIIMAAHTSVGGLVGGSCTVLGRAVLRRFKTV